MAKIIPDENVSRMAYTLEEAARIVGVSKPTMLNWVRTPGFPAFRSGKRWVIPAAALEKWLSDLAARGARLG